MRRVLSVPVHELGPQAITSLLAGVSRVAPAAVADGPLMPHLAAAAAAAPLDAFQAQQVAPLSHTRLGLALNPVPHAVHSHDIAQTQETSGGWAVVSLMQGPSVVSLIIRPRSLTLSSLGPGLPHARPPRRRRGLPALFRTRAYPNVAQ